MNDDSASRIADLEERIAALELSNRWSRRYNLAMIAGVIAGLVLLAGGLRSGRLEARFDTVHAQRVLVGDTHPITLETTPEGAFVSVGEGPGPALRLTSDADGAGLGVQHPDASLELGITGSLPHIYLDGKAGRASLTVAGHPELRLRDGSRQHAMRLEASATGAAVDLINGTDDDDRVQITVGEGLPPQVSVRAAGAEVPVVLGPEGVEGAPTPSRRPAARPAPPPPTDSPSTP